MNAESINRTQVRFARARDSEPLRLFLAGLSPVSQYLRFFGGLGSVSPSLVRRLVTVTPQQLALLAWQGNHVVGHAMAVCVGERTVDVGIVVADCCHGAGIGDQLIHRLVDVVSQFGVDQVRLDVLSENHIVLDWMRRRLPDIAFERSGPFVTAHGHLAA